MTGGSINIKNNKVMKADEAPKSKFVYPDKLYARTNNNITLDISYAPQTLEAVEYIRTDAFIEKACDYLMEYEFNDSPTIADRRKRVDEFVNYMKGE